MKTTNFWRTLFFSALAVTAFASCSKDDADDKGFTGQPSISVNGKSETTVAHDLTQGTTPVVEVVSAGPWSIARDNANDTWCTPSVWEGKGGKTDLKFEVGPATAAREAAFTIVAPGKISGVDISLKAKIVVKQNASGSFEVIFKETAGDKTIASPWPLAGVYDGWKTTGSGASAVTYAGVSASVRSTGLANTGAYEGASGPNVVFFGVLPATFTVQNIALTAAQTNLQLVFGASYSYKPQGATEYDNTFNPDNFKVLLSGDGTNFVPLTYTVNDGDKKSPYWVLATADFTLTKASSKLYIRFEALAASAIRLDDITLQTGNGGQSIDLDAIAPEPDFTEATINEIDAVGNYKVDATIVGVYQKGVMFADNAGGTNNYIMAFNNAWTTQTANPYIGNVNYKAVVKGAVKDQHGLWQFDAPEVTVGAANAFNLGTPATFDAAAIQAYAAAIQADEKAAEYKYIQLSGALTIAPATGYNVYTVAVAGLSNELVKTVTMAYGLDSYYTAAGAVSGDVVNIEGFALGFDTTKGNLNIMVTKVSKNTSTAAINITTTSASFLATAGDAHAIAFTTANLGSNKVFAKIEGADAGQFTVPAGAITGNSVTVTSVANTTTNTRTATLVVYVAASENGNVVVKDEITLTQAPAGVTNYAPVTVAPADWSGEYVVGYPTADACWILKDKFAGAETAKSTFTYDKLVAPVFDGTNIAYSADYNMITIAKIEGTSFYSLKYGSMYIGWTTSTGNSCAFSADAPSASTPDYQWTIEIKDGLTVLSCSTHEANKTRNFQFNANSGQERFAIYAGTQKNLLLYKL